MDRFKLFYKDMSLYSLYINLDDSVKNLFSLESVTSIYTACDMSLDSPFIKVIHSIKNSVRSKYNE
jgi:hypothetical protein